MVGYSIKLEDESKIAKAYGKELRISPKYSVEVCRELRGKKVSDAIRYLKEVIEMKRAVPFKKHKKKVPHKHGLVKACSGRYPVKVSKHILKVIESAIANARYKGLDEEKLYIKHICALRGRVIRGYIPRAFGRATPFNQETTNIQVVLEER